MALEIVPMTFAQATQFVKDHHRHNKPPVGMKFAIGLQNGDTLVGVAMAGRPVARMLNDGRTLEINRLSTDGTQNACTMLYGAVRRAAKALGYKKLVTYTQHVEGGASLRAAGWTRDAELPARGGWDKASVSRPRENIGSGDVARVRWIVTL